MNLIAGAASEGAAASLCLMSIIAISSGFFSLFMDYLLDNHPLWRYYLKWIQTLPESIAKPLGECVICSGAWHYLFISYFYFDLSPVLCLIGLGVNFVVIKVGNQIIHKN